MEPSVRPYNSNSSGQPRRRASKSNKRPSDAPARAPVRKTRSNPPTRKAVVIEMLPEPAVPVDEVAPKRADRVEAIGKQATPHEAAEAGPVVTIADFEDIFARFQTPLINFVFRLVGNREQACDLTQDVFVKAYRALSSGTTIQAAALSSWLYRIASNTATDALRRRRLISWLPLSLFNEDRGVGAGMPGMEANSNSQQGPSDEALASATNAFSAGYDGGRFEQHVADREIVESVLKRLPPKYAACLLLYEHEGFSCAEIAEVLNVSPSAVKMRLMRARERFISLYRQEVSGQ
jgi:RNA polymerase sigma-70 factor, ECF subfamily